MSYLLREEFYSKRGFLIFNVDAVVSKKRYLDANQYVYVFSSISLKPLIQHNTKFCLKNCRFRIAKNVYVLCTPFNNDEEW